MRLDCLFLGTLRPKLPTITSSRSSFLIPKASFGIKSGTQHPADPSLPMQAATTPECSACAEGNLSTDSKTVGQKRQPWAQEEPQLHAMQTMWCYFNWVSLAHKSTGAAENHVGIIYLKSRGQCSPRSWAVGIFCLQTR